MSLIPKALERIAAQWNAAQFEEGDCHTLAMALHQASAPEHAPHLRTGQLLACMRKSVDENGLLFDAGYSHMVYVSDDGQEWDIRGADAGARWEAQFDTENLDKWGLRTELYWVTVPCDHPDYSDTHSWLHERFGCVDTMLQVKLVREIRALQEAGHGY